MYIYSDIKQAKIIKNKLTMKKIILLVAVVMLAACGAPKVEEAIVAVDSAKVAVDSTAKVVDSVAVGVTGVTGATGVAK